uniref:SFRICE_032583 n=1 Tax=Spodoptera frugiperda TaxID=7108 RepID=A0A2H1X1Z1_SPOFR
MLLRHPSEE